MAVEVSGDKQGAEHCRRRHRRPYRPRHPLKSCLPSSITSKFVSNFQPLQRTHHSVIGLQTRAAIKLGPERRSRDFCSKERANKTVGTSFELRPSRHLRVRIFFVSTLAASYYGERLLLSAPRRFRVVKMKAFWFRNGGGWERRTFL